MYLLVVLTLKMYLLVALFLRPRGLEGEAVGSRGHFASKPIEKIVKIWYNELDKSEFVEEIV